LLQIDLECEWLLLDLFVKPKPANCEYVHCRFQILLVAILCLTDYVKQLDLLLRQKAEAIALLRGMKYILFVYMSQRTKLLTDW